MRRNRSLDYGDFRGDIRVYGGRRVYRSKETSHFSSHNMEETVGGDGRGESRSQTRHSFSRNHGVYHFGVDGRGVTRSQENNRSSF